MEELKYAMIVEKSEDENGVYYGAYFPDLPGCTTLGSTLEELHENARKAVNLYLETLRNHGKPIPHPTSTTSEITVKAS